LYRCPHFDGAGGGRLENRSRFALEVYRTIRSRVGPGFPVSIKLNSADFQKGGFSEEDSLAVAQMLAEAGVDLLEISGGTFENPVMTGLNIKPSTREREAFFIDYAEKVRKSVDVPLAVTGGFRSAGGMAAAVESGATDLVGLARPFCLDPAFPAAILKGRDYQSPVRPIRTGFKRVDDAGILEVGWYAVQLRLMGAGKPVKPDLSPWTALYHTVVGQGLQSIGRRQG
jgi:2,4-dienoyl-CoA reductase-like NADH-dependent reductase (Old Yellow Enzyme family)